MYKAVEFFQPLFLFYYLFSTVNFFQGIIKIECVLLYEDRRENSMVHCCCYIVIGRT
jgi:hypothetical protein